FAELQEHCALVRLLGQIGKRFAQFLDYRGASQPKEGVDPPLNFERRNVGAIRVLTGKLVEHLPGTLVIGLAIQRETQIVLIGIVATKKQCRWGRTGALLED